MRDSVKSGALTEVTFFILLSLHEHKHGYAIMQYIEELTDGRLTLGAGTLYGAINNLLDKRWIVPIESSGRKKEYELTALGEEIIFDEMARLKSVLTIADNIMGDERDDNSKE